MVAETSSVEEEGKRIFDSFCFIKAFFEGVEWMGAITGKDAAIVSEVSITML